MFDAADRLAACCSVLRPREPDMVLVVGVRQRIRLDRAADATGEIVATVLELANFGK
jgi:hypothetical protein